MSFLLVTIKNVKDQVAFDEYASKVMPLVQQYGGSYAAIDACPEVKAGEWNYLRTVIVSFPSFEMLDTWYRSPEYQAIIALRQRAFDGNVVFVRGSDEGNKTANQK